MFYLIVFLLFLTGTSLCAVVYLFQKARNPLGRSSLADEIINASDHGQVVFDKDERFLKCNTLARSQLSAIIDGDIENLTLPELLDYLYDHAADVDESIKNTIMSQYNSESAPDFREVIYLNEARLCLVHARKLNTRMTLFTLIDISKGRQQEENLRQLNTINYQLMEAIQSTTTGIAISDPNQPGNPILFVNDAFSEFTGRNDLVGGGWGILMSLFTEQEEREKFIQSLENLENVELELKKQNQDQTQYFTMTLSPVYQDGKLDLFIGLLSDVTLLKQREAEVFQSQKLESLGQLAAGIAHDFNNILSIIGGYATMTTKILDGQNEKAQGYLDKIEAASERGAGLTRKMLTFSRHKVVSKSCINMCDLIKEQSELLLPLLGVSVDMDVVLPDHDVNVMGSASSIEQIVMNLAINARDAMPDGGKLLIELTCPKPEDVPEKISSFMTDESYVHLCITDMGTGMDEKTIERIFDPFFSTKEQGKGTGLGLSVVYGLVNELGGLMDVVSEVGTGTKMSVYLPRSFETKTQSYGGELDNDAGADLNGYTVLIAEDEPDLLNVVKNMLEDMGLNVLTAKNGNEALLVQEGHEGEIDILLTDAIMPEMNGAKLAELFASIHPEAKIIFMSGYPANSKTNPTNIPEGATFIAKPVDYKKLLQILYQQLGVEGQQDQKIDLPQWKSAQDRVEGQS